jgi:hypothetical protein
MLQARLARRDGVPILDLFFLIYQEGDSWIGRSVRTGHVSESRTADGAVRNLTKAIDAEIGIIAATGIGLEQWYDSQKDDDPRYVRMFFDAIARGDPLREDCPAQDGRAVLRAVVARAA